MKRKEVEEFIVISSADAVAELSLPTGDPELDHVDEILIDCVQQGFVIPVRDKQGTLRFALSPAGSERIRGSECPIRGNFP